MKREIANKNRLELVNLQLCNPYTVFKKPIKQFLVYQISIPLKIWIQKEIPSNQLQSIYTKASQLKPYPK